jgi:hypothetical protein
VTSHGGDGQRAADGKIRGSVADLVMLGQAALKVLYLAVRNLGEFRRPNVGIRSSGWKQALQAFTIYFDGRIPTP